MALQLSLFEREERERVAVVGFLVKRIHRALHFGIAV
jgi:hypothetical protein